MNSRAQTPSPAAATDGLRPWQRIAYGLAFGVVRLISRLPMPVLYALSTFLFWLVYHVVGYRRKIVARNMRASFPDMDDAALGRLQREFYRWFCDYIVETLKLFTISPDEMRRRLVFKGTEVVQDCVDQGRSVALYLGHYCNWEWVSSIPLWLRGDYAGSQVYHVLESPVMDRLMLYPRHRMGADNVPMASVLRYIVANRQAGRPVVMGFIADQVPFWNNIGHWLTFLNHPDTPVLTGTERLARRFDMACVYVDIRRTARGRYEAEFQLMTDAPAQQQEMAVTEDYFRRLEASISRHPALWLWTHNRWKRTREEYLRMLDPQTGKLVMPDKNRPR